LIRLCSLNGWCHRQIRKRALAIVARILVARHLKTADDPVDSKPSGKNVKVSEKKPEKLIPPQK
jgi:hypothetical protein